MDKVYDQFAEALEKIVNEKDGGTWKEKAAKLRAAMEQRGADGDLDEVVSWASEN